MKQLLLAILILNFNILSAQDANLKTEVQELVKGLGSNDYTIRIESFKKLSALKIRAFPYLNQVLKEKQDFEVTEAIDKLLKNILNYNNPGLKGKPIPKTSKTSFEVVKQFSEWFSLQNFNAYSKLPDNAIPLNTAKEFFNLIIKERNNILIESERKRLVEIINTIKSQPKDTLILLHLANNEALFDLDKNIKSQFQKNAQDYKKYPLFMQFFIQLKVKEFFGQEMTIEDKEKLTKEIINLFIDGIDQKTFDSASEIYLVRSISLIWETLLRPQKEYFVTTYNNKNVPIPWLKHYVNGIYHLDLYEYYRSGGKPSGNKQKHEVVAEERAKAKECFLSAYGLFKNSPEICSYLIRLDDDTPEKAREWFDKVLALSIDFELAYNTYVNSIMYFDFEDALNFGNELLLTGDFNSFPFNYYPNLIARYYRNAQSRQTGNLDITEKQDIYQNLIYVYENSNHMKGNQELINLLIGFAYFHSDWKNLEKFHSELKGKIDLRLLTLKGNEEEIEYSIKGYLELKENKTFLAAFKGYQSFDYKSTIPMFIDLYKTSNGYSKFFIFQILLKSPFTQNDETNSLLYKFYEEIGYKELANQKIFQKFENKLPEIKQVGEKLLNLLSPFDKQCYLLMDKNKEFKLDEKDGIYKKIDDIAIGLGNISAEELLQMKIYALRFAYINNPVNAAFKGEYHQLFSNLTKPGYMLNVVRVQNEMSTSKLTLNRWYPFEALFWKKTKQADRHMDAQREFIKKALALDKTNFDKDLLSLLDVHGSIIGRLKLAQEFFKNGQIYWAARLETEALKWHYGLNRAGFDGWSAYQTMAQFLLMTGYEKNAQYYADYYCKFDAGIDSGWYLAAYINYLNGFYAKSLSCLEKGLTKNKDAGTFLLGEKQISGTTNLKNEIIDTFLKSDKYSDATKKVLEELKLK